MGKLTQRTYWPSWVHGLVVRTSKICAGGGVMMFDNIRIIRGGGQSISEEERMSELDR